MNTLADWLNSPVTKVARDFFFFCWILARIVFDMAAFAVLATVAFFAFFFVLVLVASFATMTFFP